ncbi:MAG TPA: type II toxin-antitoxin system RelE/ParE family toxin [Solirubrobacteraceae bacterium]|nr:type II toxin-antitoxin system RelE/ParE family toxin [Solirubrobacteraceae bacterium]
MAHAVFTEEAKADVRELVAEDEDIAREGLEIAKQLENDPYRGEPLREKSNLKPLAQAECRKIKFDHPNRTASAKPRYRHRLVYRIEPHEGSPETIVIMAVGIKPRVYRDATVAAARRLREQARTRRRTLD